MTASRAVRVRCRPDSYDVVVDAIWTLGPQAVSEEAGHDGTTVLTAGFADAAGADAAMARLAPFRPVRVDERDADWVRSWRIGAVPQLAGRFRVRLPEHAPDDGGDGSRIDLVIEPGPTFGFGHASTRLALELLSDSDLARRTVADVGCGSGVLAVAAALLEADRVDAVDIDRDAVEVTAANAARNGADVRVVLGSTEALALDAYDLALCNVTAAGQRDLAPSVADRLGRGGSVVLSGILDHQLDGVVDIWSTLVAGLTVARVVAEGEWRAVHLAGPGTGLVRGREGGSLTGPAL